MNIETQNLQTNNVFLTGKIVSEPKFSHESYGEAFYETYLEVERLSSTKDVLPVILSEKFLNTDSMHVGHTLCLKGQYRSFNQMQDGKSKLILRVFVREVLPQGTDIGDNIIEISGYVCKPPVYRTTPFNREICDVLVAVNRAYNKSDYIPCIGWGRNARYLRGAKVGDRLDIVGRIQSREYKKNLGDEVITKTAYEISVARVDIASQNNMLDDVEGQ